uniref:pectinesterase/pectinesterase inhibitor-like n=1 Tax=Erigeron canadensis TaxID=72917 RepID=UPI001CB9CFC3|nr:pectinesterase/pectinesterase inhibitor-like [Erigeron canadensis]
MSSKDVLNTTIYGVIHVVTNVITNVGPLLIANNVDANDQALDVCNELLGYALDDLHASLNLVEKHDPQIIREEELDLMNWLSAVVAYQETCLDGFNDRLKLRESMSKILLNATQHVFNAIAIIADMPNMSQIFNIPIVKGTGRRLLGTDESRYPVWMSVADQRLLAGGNAGLTPNAVVAKDGSGQFKTITDALAAYPKGNKGRYVVYVKQGIYDEHVIVTKNHMNVFMYGDGSAMTVVTGNRSNKTG